jgi:hypothetical protein
MTSCLRCRSIFLWSVSLAIDHVFQSIYLSESLSHSNLCVKDLYCILWFLYSSPALLTRPSSIPYVLPCHACFLSSPQNFLRINQKPPSFDDQHQIVSSICVPLFLAISFYCDGRVNFIDWAEETLAQVCLPELHPWKPLS